MREETLVGAAPGEDSHENRHLNLKRLNLGQGSPSLNISLSRASLNLSLNLRTLNLHLNRTAPRPEPKNTYTNLVSQ